MPLLGDGARRGPPEQVDQVRHDWHEPEPPHQAGIIPPDQDRPQAMRDDVESLHSDPGPDHRFCPPPRGPHPAGETHERDQDQQGVGKDEGGSRHGRGVTVHGHHRREDFVELEDELFN